MKRDDEIISVVLILKNNCFNIDLVVKIFKINILHLTCLFFNDKTNQRMKLRHLMKLNFSSNTGNGGNQHRYDYICDFDKKNTPFLLQTYTIHQ